MPTVSGLAIVLLTMDIACAMPALNAAVLVCAWAAANPIRRINTISDPIVTAIKILIMYSPIFILSVSP